MTKDGHAPNLKKDMLFRAEDVHAPKIKRDILFMAGDTHARQTPLYKGKFGEGFTFYEFSYKQTQGAPFPVRSESKARRSPGNRSKSGASKVS